jgi:hypothetical protein
MNARRASNTTLFAVSASAVCAFALALALTAPDRGAHRRPQAQRTTSPAAGLGQPIAGRSPVRTSQRDVARVATSFAVAYLNWDAGQRSRAAAATLQRLSTPAMWHTLRHQRGAPTVNRPRPGRFEPFEIARGSDGRWRVPLTTREPDGRYLGTLVLAREAEGVRVTAIDR